MKAEVVAVRLTMTYSGELELNALGHLLCCEVVCSM